MLVRKFNQVGRRKTLWEFPRQDEIKLINSYQSQMQLITGWIQLSEDMILYEVHSTASVLGTLLDFIIHSINEIEVLK